MISVVLLVKDRPALTRQCLESMVRHTAVPINVTAVDDASDEATQNVIASFQSRDRCAVARVHSTDTEHGIVGGLRNRGIRESESAFGRGQFLYLSDNDAYFLPGWAETLTAALQFGEPGGLRLLGGTTHPYHRPSPFLKVDHVTAICAHDAVQGLSHLLRWETWDRYGPFDSNARGTNQSEDFAFCQRIVKGGFKVGSVYPRAVINCGLVDSYGRPCVGYAEVKAELEEEIRRHRLAGKVLCETSREAARWFA